MYKHGSNMILFFKGKAIGHCTSCEIQDQSETKSRSIKALPDYSAGNEENDPDLKAAQGEDTTHDGLWDEKSVSKRTTTVSCDALDFEGDSGATYDELLAAMDAGEKVKLKYAYKGEENTKYRVGLFVITSLQRNDPADDDSTFNASFENSGKVRVRPVANA